MFLGRRPSQLVVYRAQMITVYTDRHAEPISRRFPQDFISHQEVLAPEQLLESLIAFFKEIKLNRKTLVLLANDVVFHKQFSPPITSDTDPRVQLFLDEVPFLKEQLAIKILTNNGVSSIIATNRETPQTIAQAIRKAGGKYVGSVPMTAYTKKFHNPLTKDEVADILNNISVNTTAQIDTDQRKSDKRMIAFLSLLVVFLLISLAIVGSKFVTTLPSFTF